MSRLSALGSPSHDLDVMARDSRRMRGTGPFVFAQVTNGIGVQEIANALVTNWRAARISSAVQK